MPSNNEKTSQPYTPSSHPWLRNHATPKPQELFDVVIDPDTRTMTITTPDGKARNYPLLYLLMCPFSGSPVMAVTSTRRKKPIEEAKGCREGKVFKVGQHIGIMFKKTCTPHVYKKNGRPYSVTYFYGFNMQRLLLECHANTAEPGKDFEAFSKAVLGGRLKTYRLVKETVKGEDDMIAVKRAHTAAAREEVEDAQDQIETEEAA